MSSSVSRSRSGRRTSITAIQHILATAEFRRSQWNDLEKAAHLAVECGFSISSVSSFFRLDRKRVSNALKTLGKGRRIGLRGRPRLLLSPEERDVIDFAQQRHRQHDAVSPRELEQVVCFCSLRNDVFIS